VAFAIEIPRSDSARLDITSRTSFGIDIDNPYRYGLLNELTQFDLVFGLAPYSPTSNRLNSPDAVGFINVTLFNLDLVKTQKSVGYNAPGPIGTNRYQTGEFFAGIAKGPWLIQLNAGANEPFASPWNKGMQFINDDFNFSWAYLDSMVDVRRVRAITGIPVITRRGEENMIGDGDIGSNDTMRQFGFDGVGQVADRFAPTMIYNISNPPKMVTVMYNADAFGVNVKLGTQYSFDSDQITENNANGIAMGVDSVFTPAAVSGLKIFASVMGTVNWGPDKDSDPIFGGTRIGYNIPLNDEISIEPFVGADVGIKIKDKGGTENLGYEVSGGLNMRWPGFAGWGKDYILNSDGRAFPGMSLSYKIYEEKEKYSYTGTHDTGMEHAIKFTLFEPKGDEGLFYKIGAEIIVDLVDLTNAAWDNEGFPHTEGLDPKKGRSLLATAYVDYELGRIGKIPGSFVPWTILYYDNLSGDSKDADRINDFKIDLGINLENAIANTTFGLVWNSGSLIQGTTETIGGGNKIDHKAGYVRLFAEIRL
jgi:hypothetical protein